PDTSPVSLHDALPISGGSSDIGERRGTVHARAEYVERNATIVGTGQRRSADDGAARVPDRIAGRGKPRVDRHLRGLVGPVERMLDRKSTRLNSSHLGR